MFGGEYLLENYIINLLRKKNNEKLYVTKLPQLKIVYGKLEVYI